MQLNSIMYHNRKSLDFLITGTNPLARVRTQNKLLNYSLTKTQSFSRKNAKLLKADGSRLLEKKVSIQSCFDIFRYK